MTGSHFAELERRTYHVAINDGLPDILLGIFMLGIGLAILTDLTVIPAVVTLVAGKMWSRLRERFVAPRIGHVRLLPSRMDKLRRGRIVLNLAALAVLGGVLLILALGEAWRASVRGWGTLLLGALLALGVALSASLFQARRGYAYAALILLVFALAQGIGAPRPGAPFAAGAMIIGSGFFLLLNFMRRYPVESDILGGDV